MPFEIDRRAFIASLGGATAVTLMSHEARADALEDYSIHKLDEVVAQAQAGQNAGAPEKFPTMAELEARIDGSANRRGVGNLFVAPRTGRSSGSSRCQSSRRSWTSSSCVSSRPTTCCRAPRAR